MAFERPTLAELVDRIEQDFISRVGLTSPLLRRAFVRVLARVWAGATHMLHGHLDYLARQLFPDQSVEEFLVRQGSLFGVDRNPPEFAQATVTVTGVNATVIPAGTVLTRASDGAEYTTDADGTISGGTVDIAVTASVAGADSTLDVGQVLAFESPISGADADPEVASSDVDGSDEESEEDYRTRVLERMGDTPTGGSEPDYVAWAKQVPGVTRAWVEPRGLGAGTVVVRFVRDDDASPIPDSGEVATVQAVFDEEAPAHAAPTAVAPTAAPVAFTIEPTPNTTVVRDAIEAEIEDLLRREGEPGETLLLASVRTAVGTATGLTNYVMTVPSADVAHTANQIPTLGVITWLP